MPVCMLSHVGIQFSHDLTMSTRTKNLIQLFEEKAGADRSGSWFAVSAEHE